jgi:predicted ATP-dependent serine protease
MKQSTLKKSLSPHQLEIFSKITAQLEDIVETGMVWDNVLVLSGAAGTGKTYLTTVIVEALHKKYKVTITAPTHKALRVIAYNVCRGSRLPSWYSQSSHNGFILIGK